MGLFKRVGDIISANLNELLDGVENPEVMLKQAVREMETARAATMDSAARVIANERLSQKQLVEHRIHLDRWQQEAARAVQVGDDERARFALSRKLERSKLISALEDQLASAAATSLKLKRQIEAMRVRLTEARTKLVNLIARKQAASARKHFASRLNGVAVGAGAFGRFEQLCSRVEQEEAEADALVELGGALESFEEFDPDIEAELESLKCDPAFRDANSSLQAEARE